MPTPTPQAPGAHMTPKATRLSGPGGYTTTTPTLKGGAGDLKPMGGGTANKVNNKAQSPFARGKRGTDKNRHDALKNVPRTIVAEVNPL
jgi:hypothetical protein